MRRSPWMLAAALALVGVGGAVAVYKAGSRISASDRAAVIAWEQAAAEIVREPRALLDALGAVASDLPDARGRLLDAKLSFMQAAAVLASLDTPPIMRRTGAELDAFLGRASDAVHLLGGTRDADAWAGELAELRLLYERARDTLIRLRCRARIPACEQTSLP